MTLTYDDILTLLLIVAAVMLVIVLYHLMFVAFNLRRISRDVRGVTDRLEEAIGKPLDALNYMIDWVTETVRDMAKKKHHRSSHKKKGEAKEVVVEEVGAEV